MKGWEHAMRTYQEIGEFITVERKRLGITQRELADMVGVGRVTIVNIEMGALKTDVARLGDIFKALGHELRIEADKDAEKEKKEASNGGR